MEVIKKINNNSAVCIDSAGNEIVAIGTGIGFPSVPYTLEDLSKIQRTYYDVSPMYLDLLNQIPEEVFDVSSTIVEWFRSNANTTISSNLVFTLADHINFAIERENKNILIENPLQYEIKHLYEDEYEIGLKAIKLIYQELGVRLPKTEASNIALHLMNAKTTLGSENKNFHFEEVLSDVVEIIGKHFRMYIDKDSVSYSRFVSHFQYLLKREQANKHISSENYKLFQSVTKEYPDTYQCVLKIRDYLDKELDFKLTDEEMLYLILHVNRLCVREDCN
ncbi:transcriptional regulator [Tetragenococcus halophilus subsp. flandriensis]|uniref:PRD domain-containing protein n=1 Tax=Tetragenococcus halophilus TaxID=51669 RepID=UPI0023E93443|nr:PRD domain-containing protein [Tetragenococcus halophilus]GMA08676.1 transcriptional regulator [Tetragenococcus halophilus subsp. flandriensis]